MKCVMCSTENCACLKDIGLLMLRLIIGAVFIYHGWAKVSDIAGTTGFFSSIGLGSPLLVYTAAYGEFIGGIMMILGVFVRYVSPVLVVIMAVAIQTVHVSKGFNIMQGGYEYALTLLVVSAAIGMLGAGKYSIDSQLKNNSVAK